MIRRTSAVFPAIAMVFAIAAATGCAPNRPNFPTAQENADSLRRAYDLAIRAQAAEADGKKKDAIDLYRQALNANADLPAVWNNLGVLLMDEGNYNDAAGAFRVAADLSPSDPRPLENLGVTYMRVGWASEALVHFERALQRDPNYLPALRGAVQAGTLLGKRDDDQLKRVEKALVLERDPKWREIFEREYIGLNAKRPATAR